MDIVREDPRPIRSVGEGGHVGTATDVAQTDQGVPPILDEPEAPVWFGDDDAWPPHFGAARLGIP